MSVNWRQQSAVCSDALFTSHVSKL